MPARPLAALLFALLTLCVAAPRADAHPYHVAFLEADANPETSRLEVAMRVFPEDLERAAALRLGMDRVSLERTPGVGEILSDYLARTILLRDPDAPEPDPDDQSDDEHPERSRVHWVGMELGVRHTWLYFEIELDAPEIEGLEISVRSMFEVEPTQVNAVRFRRGEERVTLRCTRDQPWAIIDFSPEPEDERPLLREREPEAADRK